MFDSYQKNQQNIKINAVSGTIVKNYKGSFFRRFHLKSSLADKVLAHRPEYPINYTSKPVVVLQMMVCGDMEVIAELMFKDDFDKLFEEDGDSDETD